MGRKAVTSWASTYRSQWPPVADGIGSPAQPLTSFPAPARQPPPSSPPCASVLQPLLHATPSSFSPLHTFLIPQLTVLHLQHSSTRSLPCPHQVAFFPSCAPKAAVCPQSLAFLAPTSITTTTTGQRPSRLQVGTC